MPNTEQTAQFYKSLFTVWRSRFETFGTAYAWITALAFFTCAVVGYLIGSFVFGLVISRLRHDDIRSHGSGNAGATNVARTYGTAAGIVTLIGDLGKGALAAAVGMWLFGTTGMAVAGFFVVIGHMYPLYFGFRGGKGVSTAFGVSLVANPIVSVGLVVVFLIVFLGSHYVSLASVMAAFLYPLLMSAFMKAADMGDSPAIVMAVVTAVMVVFAHRANLKRLYNRLEPKLFFNAEKKAADLERLEAERKEQAKNKGK